MALSNPWAVNAAAACPKDSTINTPGITGLSGKWPWTKKLSFLTLTTAVADDVVSVGTLAIDTAQTVVVAGADLGKGVVKTVSDEVDRQTDELQDEDKDEPKKD